MSIVNTILKIRKPKPRSSVLRCIKERFSPRVFSSVAIPDEHISLILEAARWAPSGRNTQPWFFYVGKKGSPVYDKFQSCIPERNGWALSAPLIIIACYEPNDSSGAVNKWAQYDLGAAVISTVLQAQELGYYSRQIGSFDSSITKEVFKIPDPYIPFTLIAMGKIGNENDYAVADKGYVEKDCAPSVRKEIIYKELP